MKLVNAVNDKLNNTKIEWKKVKSMTIVLCSKGYPGNYKKNIIIKNIDKIKLKKNETIYHAGTKLENNSVFSNGGRVLNFTSFVKNYLLVRKQILKLIQRLNWKYGFFRKDIGWRI